MPLLKGKHYFCNVLFAHMGDESVMLNRLQAMVDNLAKSGAKEIVFVHDDCYAVLKGIAPEYGIKVPFRPVHLFEYLRDYLKENKGKVRKLNMKVAYQRPCASRYTPEKDYLCMKSSISSGWSGQSASMTVSMPYVAAWRWRAQG
jgi:Fe-S oxidoreductase